jgi:hypothetical protein
LPATRNLPELPGMGGRVIDVATGFGDRFPHL